MPIIRCKDQKSQSLVEFYEEISEQYDSIVNIGLQMIKLIDQINKTFVKTQLYGLTSHARLIILSEDIAESKWYITIGTNGMSGGYYIDYLIPEKKSPWENAMVSGETNKIEDALKYILISMRECEGWIGNEELETLLESLK